MNNDYPLMQCGHAANSKDKNGNPCCVICCSFREGWNKIAEVQPDLSNRKAKCPDCHTFVPSNFDLAFFEYRPNREYDSFYCGCRGWD